MDGILAAASSFAQGDDGVQSSVKALAVTASPTPEGSIVPANVTPEAIAAAVQAVQAAAAQRAALTAAAAQADTACTKSASELTKLTLQVAAEAQSGLPALQAQLDEANAVIAELTSQLATAQARATAAEDKMNTIASLLGTGGPPVGASPPAPSPAPAVAVQPAAAAATLPPVPETQSQEQSLPPSRLQPKPLQDPPSPPPPASAASASGMDVTMDEGASATPPPPAPATSIKAEATPPTQWVVDSEGVDMAAAVQDNRLCLVQLSTGKSVALDHGSNVAGRQLGSADGFDALGMKVHRKHAELVLAPTAADVGMTVRRMGANSLTVINAAAAVSSGIVTPSEGGVTVASSVDVPAVTASVTAVGGGVALGKDEPAPLALGDVLVMAAAPAATFLLALAPQAQPTRGTKRGREGEEGFQGADKRARGE